METQPFGLLTYTVYIAHETHSVRSNWDTHMTRQCGYGHTFCQNVVYTHTKKKMLLLTRCARELQKATVSFVMSVRLSVRMEQLGSHWTDFNEISYIFRKSIQKIQVLLKSDRKNGHYTWRTIYIYIQGPPKKMYTHFNRYHPLKCIHIFGGPCISVYNSRQAVYDLIWIWGE
jgi:hypothetical protein